MPRLPRLHVPQSFIALRTTILFPPPCSYTTDSSTRLPPLLLHVYRCYPLRSTITFTFLDLRYDAFYVDRYTCAFTTHHVLRYTISVTFTRSLPVTWLFLPVYTPAPRTLHTLHSITLPLPFYVFFVRFPRCCYVPLVTVTHMPPLPHVCLIWLFFGLHAFCVCRYAVTFGDTTFYLRCCWCCSTDPITLILICCCYDL